MVIATRLLDLPRELFENIVARVVVEATDPVATLVDLKTVCLRMYREACRGKVVGMTLPLIRSLPRVADAVARENLIFGSAAVGNREANIIIALRGVFASHAEPPVTPLATLERFARKGHPRGFIHVWRDLVLH